MWWSIGIVLVLLIIHPFILKKHTKNTLSLNTDRLHLQYFFQIALFIPFIISMFLMFWVGHEYPPRWDGIGFNFFLDIQKLPLGILALSPILGAFVVYAHRSLQTEKQIKTAEKQLEEAQKKNKVDIYFSQRKFIIDQLERIQLYDYGKISNANNVYNKFIAFNNYDNKLIKGSFEFISLRIEYMHTSFNNAKLYIGKNSNDNSALEKSISELKLRDIAIQFENIITYLEIETNEINEIKIKIKNIIDDFFGNNHRNINDYKITLDNLLFKISFEIKRLYYFLHKLFTLILLNKDISEFLPNLEKINLIHSHNGT